MFHDAFLFKVLHTVIDLCFSSIHIALLLAPWEDQMDHQYRTALHEAAAGGCGSVKLLLDARVNSHAADVEGRTALYEAACHNQKPLGQLGS